MTILESLDLITVIPLLALGYWLLALLTGLKQNNKR